MTLGKNKVFKLPRRKKTLADLEREVCIVESEQGNPESIKCSVSRTGPAIPDKRHSK